MAIPNRFERNARKTLVAIVALGGTLALALAEAGARVWCPQWAPARAERVLFWQYDSLLGWSHHPGQRGRFVHQDFSVEVRINSDGLRGRDYPVGRTGRTRILVLGDSFGWGFGVEGEQVFSGILEKDHPDWEVINASVSGYGTDQEYLYLKERGRKYRPDVVLLLFSRNDYHNNLSREEYWYNKPYFEVGADGLLLRNNPVPLASFRQQLQRACFSHSYVLPRVLLALAPPAAESLDETVPSAAPQNERAEVTLRLLRATRDVAAVIGARFVLVSVPMPAHKRRPLRELADRDALSYLALDASFSGRGEPLTFPHDDHWNSSGHRVTAAAIGEFLAKLLSGAV